MTTKRFICIATIAIFSVSCNHSPTVNGEQLYKTGPQLPNGFVVADNWDTGDHGDILRRAGILGAFLNSDDIQTNKQTIDISGEEVEEVSTLYKLEDRNYEYRLAEVETDHYWKTNYRGESEFVSSSTTYVLAFKEK
jgi:hypothetical protein